MSSPKSLLREFFTSAHRALLASTAAPSTSGSRPLRLLEEDGSERLGELLVDRLDTPFESRDIETIGLKAWPLSELFFDGIEVPAVNRLGPAGATQAARRDRRRKAPDFRDARCMCALAACGIAQRAFEIALAYTRERKQFGREIGRFQLVQALLADMAMDLEAARLLSYRARQVMTVTPGDSEVSIAKAFATEMAVRVTSKAMECLGAMGLTREAYIERLYRDARMWIVPDGTAQIQRLVIGRESTLSIPPSGWSLGVDRATKEELEGTLQLSTPGVYRFKTK